MLETGINGHTSVAPNLGCSPLCLVISIFSLATFIALKAALITESGSPTKVITVLFVALPGSTFKRWTPFVLEIESEISFIISLFLHSEKLGTHSIILFINAKLVINYRFPLSYIWMRVLTYLDCTKYLYNCQS